jgi:phosphocarrier protein
MIECKTIISNKLGLHARAASKLVSLASKYESETQIIVSDTGVLANCKSIMGIMMLGAAKGTNVTITASGVDAQTALKKVVGLIEDKFGEE